MRDACLTESDKSLVSVSIEGNASFSTSATRICRLSGFCLGAVRQDVLVVADMDLRLEEERGHASWSAPKGVREEGEEAKGIREQREKGIREKPKSSKGIRGKQFAKWKSRRGIRD